MLKGQCHEMVIFEGFNILIRIFCVCADGFQCHSTAFHCLIQLLTIYLLLRNYFHCQDRRFREFEIFSKEQAKTLSMIFHSQRKKY